MRLKAGDIVPVDSVESVEGNKVLLRESKGYVHLQLRRFSGCIFCNVHLAAMSKITEKLNHLGVTEVVVFASSKEAIAKNLTHSLTRFANFEKMDLIADPTKKLYKDFGAEEKPNSVIDEFLAKFKWDSFWKENMEKAKKLFPNDMEGMKVGRAQMPMDAIIDCSSGRIIDIYYGENPNDQWSPKEVLKIAHSINRSRSSSVVNRDEKDEEKDRSGIIHPDEMNEGKSQSTLHA